MAWMQLFEVDPGGWQQIRLQMLDLEGHLYSTRATETGEGVAFSRLEGEPVDV